MKNAIHKTAKVHKTAIIAPGVKIGAYTKIGAFVEIRAGVTIGENCKIDSYVCMTGGAIIGDNCTIRNRVTIARGTVIGRNCFIAPHCMFNNLDLGKDKGEKIGGATLGDFVTIGTSCIIHHGVTIVAGSTIGAGSFVRKSILSAGVYITKSELQKL
jgi:UDP-N-acetylglucosamine acyltransferase